MSILNECLYTTTKLTLAEQELVDIYKELTQEEQYLCDLRECISIVEKNDLPGNCIFVRDNRWQGHYIHGDNFFDLNSLKYVNVPQGVYFDLQPKGLILDNTKVSKQEFYQRIKDTKRRIRSLNRMYSLAYNTVVEERKTGKSKVMKETETTILSKQIEVKKEELNNLKRTIKDLSTQLKQLKKIK